MQLYNQTEDINLIGVQVKTFPTGIKEAFESLIKTFGNRAFYGVSWMDKENHIIYYAMAQKALDDKVNLNNYETLTIKKGVYECESLYNWMDKTDCIKDVFTRLTAGRMPDKNHPC